MSSDPTLPRLPEDPDQLHRLREEALRHLQDEERLGPTPVYGGPPIGGGVSRRWTLKRILFVVLGAIAAGLAAFFALRKRAPEPHIVIYGAPPIDRTRKDNPVYGGPIPPRPRDKSRERTKPHTQPVPGPKPVPPGKKPTDSTDPAPGPPAAVYGGPVPPPKPQAPPQSPQ